MVDPEVFLRISSKKLFGSVSCSQNRGKLGTICLISVLILLGESVSALSPSFPLGARPPVGACQVTKNHRCWARERRPRIRKCLRKGCRRRYQARNWNQRHCQDPECLRRVRRWQAARRQAKRRRDADVRAQHAEAERERRQRATLVSQAVDAAELTPVRGHATKPFFRFRSAIGQGATKPPRSRSAAEHAIAAPPVAKPFVMSKTVNASGSPAARWMAVRSDSSNTRQLATAAFHSKAASLTHHRYERLPIEDVSRTSRSSIIA